MLKSRLIVIIYLAKLTTQKQKPTIRSVFVAISELLAKLTSDRKVDPINVIKAS